MRRGQVAIIVLLVSAVMMTVGLSLSKKATTETKIDTNEESLKKAFNAAESGIDYYLGTGKTDYSAPDNLSSAKITANDIGASGSNLDFNEYTPINGSEFYWLVNHDNGDIGLTYFVAPTVNVCGKGFTGSMEINYFYRVGADFGVNRYGYNFSSDVTKRVTGFTTGTGSCATINIVNSPILVTVTALFDGGKFYLSSAAAGGTFPSQGVEINSVGKYGGVAVGVSGTQVNKKLRVLRRYKIPAFMLSGIVSETSVLSD